MTFVDQGTPTKTGNIVDSFDVRPAIFRVQTVPHRSGVLEFIVEYRKPEIGSVFQNVFNYKTTKPYPYGITYAVFGSRNTSAASYSIRDGNHFSFNDKIL